MKWRKKASRGWHYITEGVWDVELSSLSVRRRFGIGAIRVLHLIWRGFREDECPLHASALTFTSLMSIVPVLALSLALARGLGGDDAAKTWIRARVADWTDTFQHAKEQADRLSHPHAEVAAGMARAVSTNSITYALADDDSVDPAVLAAQINRMVEAGFSKMDNVSFGALGGVGLALLVWMVIAVLGQVESSFNTVWGITVERSLWRKFTDYLSILLILPFLLLVASSLPIADYVTRYLNPASAQVVNHVLGSGLLKHATVFVLTSLAFAALISLMPNTRVKVVPALSGGAITAILFLLWLWVCAWLQVGAARAGRIYGSFATLPILLAWVNVSWQIVFLGAEAAFAIQNCRTYRMEQRSGQASMRARLTLALAVVTETARLMIRDGKPLDVTAYAQGRQVPVRFLLSVVDELVKAGLMAEVKTASGGYVLLRAPESILVRTIVDGILRTGAPPEALGLATAPPDVIRALVRMDEGLEQALQQHTVRDLVGAASP